MPNYPLIHDNYQDGVCYAMSGKVHDDPLENDDPLIRDYHQGGMCPTVSVKVLDIH